jgi:predicted phage-related endonuclease
MQDTVNKDRDKYIGGSDIPVIMNLSPFKTRYDLLLEKAGYKEDLFEGNIYTEYGNTLEPKIRDYINKELNSNYIEGKHTREATEGEIIGVRIHTDGEDEDSILEIKTTSQIYESVDDYKIYLVQLLYYMVNTGKTRGILAVYDRPEDLNEELDPERLHIYKITSDEYKDLIEDIGKAIEIFIKDLQKVKDNPFITEEELLPAEIPDITKRILAFEDQLRYMKKVEAEIKSEKARLKRAMEANSVKSWTTPNGYKITLIPDGEDKIIEESYLNTDKLAQEKPEVIKEYTEIRKVEKKGRSGYIKITEPKGKEA